MKQRVVFGVIRAVRFARHNAGPILGVLSVVTVLLGLVGFEYEAAHRGVPMSVAEALYNSVGLFAFAGNRFGFPETPILVVVYFLASFISASAVVETVFRLLHARSSFVLSWIWEHTVVCGAGTVGELLLEDCDARGVPAVAVNDVDPGVGTLHGALLVRGHMAAEQVLKAARVERAWALYVTTADDLLNMDVARIVKDSMRVRGVRIFCHLSDGAIRDVLVPAQGAGFSDRIRYFNLHRVAAKALLARVLQKRWLPGIEVEAGAMLCVRHGSNGEASAATALTTCKAVSPGEFPVVVVVGLGRFGYAVLEQLVDTLPQSVELFALDKDAASIRRARLGLGRRSARFGLRGDARVKWLTGEVEALEGLQVKGTVPARALVFLCTDQPRSNVRWALALSEESAGMRVVVRMGDEGFGRRFAGPHSMKESNILAVGLRELFRDGRPILEHQQDISDGGARVRACVWPGSDRPAERGRWWSPRPSRAPSAWYLVRLEAGQSAPKGEALALEVEGLPLPARWCVLSAAGLASMDSAPSGS